jgi:SAM-dependent methyltransferase
MSDSAETIMQDHWDERATRETERESVNPRKQIHTDLLWREIRKRIGDRNNLSILDAGAGTGRFSLSLAASGHKVTHLDLSSRMLEVAAEKSEALGITGIDFVQGSIDHLARFGERSFDLVLCLDSPLSFCYDNYEAALGELVRVARSQIVLCLMNKLGVISEGGMAFDLQHFGRPQTVLEVYETGTLLVTDELKRLQSLTPSWHAFTPDEIRRLLEARNCDLERISAPGTLARFISVEQIKKLLTERASYESYLDFEETYDAEASVLGVGAQGAGGLLVTVRKQRT